MKQCKVCGYEGGKANHSCRLILQKKCKQIVSENIKMRKALDTIQKVAMIRCDHDTVVLTQSALDK